MFEQIGIYSGIFVTSFIVALSGAMMPGPLLTVTITESTKRGAWAGPLLMVGHSILEFVFILLILFGLGEILKQDKILSGIAFFGSAVLLWMGLGMIKSVKTITLLGDENKSTKKEKSSLIKNPILAGIFVSLSNPYWTVWWLTIGLAYIFMSIKFGIVGIAVFFVGHILADFAWYTFISTSITFGKKYFSDKIYKGVIGFCGVFLLLFSILFFKAGFDYLLKT
jgi:threonine/homoserine/homoserine lactone efflux protein